MQPVEGQDDRYSRAYHWVVPASAASSKGVPVRRQKGGNDRRSLALGGAQSRGRALRMGRVLSLLVAGVTALSGVLVSVGPAGAQSSSSSSSAPGVTSTAINVGAIGTLSGQLASDFADFVPGVKAYFDQIDAQGGVNGRKVNLSYNLDDAGTPSEFTAQAHALVNQDHAFAAMISSYWFTPSYFASQNIPTFGYNVSGNWAGPKNLFASGGSVLCYSCIMPSWVYLLHKTNSKNVALLAYNVSASKGACSQAQTSFKQAGVNVGYTDFNVPIDGNITPDIQRMQHAGSDFVISCMDAQENVTMARAIKQYGLKTKQLWLNGNDQGLINKNSSNMQGVYFLDQWVPPSSPTKYYPGLGYFQAAMKKYQPQYVGDELAIQGWMAASLLVAGIKAAGSNLTQQAVINADNKLTAFSADGMTTTVNWTVSHSGITYPNCAAYTKLQGTKQAVQFTSGHQVFLCFNKGLNNPQPVKAPAGTPGT